MAESVHRAGQVVEQPHQLPRVQAGRFEQGGADRSAELVGVVGERVRSWRVHLQSVGTVVFYAWYGVAVLAMLHLVVAAPTRLQETASIAAASVLGGITRFLLLRSWVFTPRSAAAGRIPGTPEVPATPALAGDGR